MPEKPSLPDHHEIARDFILPERWKWLSEDADSSIGYLVFPLPTQLTKEELATAFRQNLNLEPLEILKDSRRAELQVHPHESVFFLKLDLAKADKKALKKFIEYMDTWQVDRIAALMQTQQLGALESSLTRKDRRDLATIVRDCLGEIRKAINSAPSSF